MSWQWQHDFLWQSCADEARAQANTWQRQTAQHSAVLKLLAAQQPLVAIAEDAALLTQCETQAHALRGLSDRLVVIGTGGASLGAHTLTALAQDPESVCFLENCDPVTLQAFFRRDRARTSWLIVSKSGETVETLATALHLVAHYGSEELRSRVRVITGSADSTLRRLSAAQGWEILPHPDALGGRFSVFSIVGLLPAAYAGIDIRAVARAAQTSLQQALTDELVMVHAAWLAANAASKPMQVLMAYSDRLRPATQWYKQLLAESIGKDQRGMTPVTAIGAIDQHSQLQLYLDGPRDKLLTLWLPDAEDDGVALPATMVAGAEFLAGKTMRDVMRATAEATVTTLAQAGLPLRVVRGRLTPETLAAWMARQMVETLLIAVLLNVDPYSQPAVEAGKKLTRAALAGTP